ncbi:MAG: hypothetical protein U0869_07795 [Chloroflexota bacterium]
MTLAFWPWQPLGEGEGVEPDAFGTATSGALVVEAKAGSPFSRRQLEREAAAARLLIGHHPLGLLTIGDDERPPHAARGLTTHHGGPYDHVRHLGWVTVYAFLEHVHATSDDAGYRRLVQDALGVLDRLDRRPFRGVPMTHLRRIPAGLEALDRLAGEIAILHRRLAAALEPLGLVAVTGENVVRMDGLGRSLGQPSSWFPTQAMLAFGSPERTPTGDYYFVRLLLRQPAVWVGLSLEAHRLRSLKTPASVVSGLASQTHAEGLEVAGVDWLPSRANLVRVQVEPQPLDSASVATILATPTCQRVEVVRVLPSRVLSSRSGASRLEQELVRLVQLARATDELGAP